MKIRPIVLLAFAALAFSATDLFAGYKLYSPSEQGGMVSSDGTWEITDPCAASADAQ